MVIGNNILESSDALVNDFEHCKSILEDINWNFYQTIFNTGNDILPFDCRKYISYPATYVPEIPFSLIEVLSKPGAVILDPFSGSGTTYFQSLILGRTPIAVDINAVSSEYTKNLFKLFNPDLNRTKILAEIKSIVGKFDYEFDYLANYDNKQTAAFLKPWYSTLSLNMILYLLNFIKPESDDPTNLTIRLIMLSLLKNACSQDRSLGCIADNVYPKASELKDKKVFNILISKANILISNIEERLRILRNSEFVTNYKNVLLKDTILQGDFLTVPLVSNSIDCIITSPPYPNMADYTTSQRLAYYYLEKSIDSDKELEIGARSKRQRKNAIPEYIDSMIKVGTKLIEVLKNDGYLALVLPEFDSNHQRDSIRAGAINSFLEHLTSNGMIEMSVFERIIPTMKRSNNAKWATLKKEKIYIYQKHQYGD